MIMDSPQSIITITGSHSLVIFHLAQKGTREASGIEGPGSTVAALAGTGI